MKRDVARGTTHARSARPRGGPVARGDRGERRGLRRMSVGIFDSGLGGLTVWEAVRRRLPDRPLLYHADSANAPYGVRTMDDVHGLTVAAVARMWEEVDLVVLACNTASAAALRRMQEAGVPRGKRVLGVFVPLIEALTERGWGDNSPPRQVAVSQVALFATPRDGREPGVPARARLPRHRRRRRGAGLRRGSSTRSRTATGIWRRRSCVPMSTP